MSSYNVYARRVVYFSLEPYAYFRTGDKTSLQCLDKHPTQPHIVCTGGQDGALTVWDMRQDRFPITVLNAHSGPSKSATV